MCMKPLIQLAETELPTGARLELQERDSSYFLLEDGVQTASSYAHGGDDRVAELGAAPVKRANQPSVLIVGLGLGFMLREAMRQLNREKASFVVAEPCRALVEWHHEHLVALHPGLLDDPRVSIQYCTGVQAARQAAGKYHAVMMRSTHERCTLTPAEANDYSAAVKQGGMLLILLARPDKKLERVLQQAGFDTSVDVAPVSHKGKQTAQQTILLARKGRFVPYAMRRK